MSSNVVDRQVIILQGSIRSRPGKVQQTLPVRDLWPTVAILSSKIGDNCKGLKHA